MSVADILKRKGSVVKSVSPDVPAQTFARLLQKEGIGAMVVKNGDGSIAGIISERDLAYGLATHGSNLGHLNVSDLMTKAVITCCPSDSLSQIMKVMTERRIRHLPVLDGQALVGIVTIGDVLKFRLEETQMEAAVLRDYAIARG
jgi:CBS domain-containing protein